MAEKIHVEGTLRSVTQAAQFTTKCLWTQQGAGKRAKAASVTHCDGERAVLHAGHGRLDDRQIDAEKCRDVHAAT